VAKERRFEVQSSFRPAGDQPEAIASLAQGVEDGLRYQTLEGITGSGKTATVAWMIEAVQRPTLIIEPNKSLAAQLASELKELLPENRVEFFVSYYDYYQPEAYLPRTDTFIEKDSSINDEIDRLRHSATSSLLTRRDVVVVASVSCIYGLGNPLEYESRVLAVHVGDEVDQRDLLRRLVDLQYARNDLSLTRGTFRSRGDTVELHPVYEEQGVRIELFGDTVEKISTFDPVTGDATGSLDEIIVFAATHYVAGDAAMRRAILSIEDELREQLSFFDREGKLLEAQRLRTRTEHDLEMLAETGVCAGVENYSRHFDGRAPGERPYTLLDFFPRDLLVVVDESHVAVPQIRGQFAGDRSRKDVLVEHGFRLPSAKDNRPLTIEEFLEVVPQAVFVSATPGPFELEVSDQIAYQIIRPTGLLDPLVEIRPTRGQIDDLRSEISREVERGGRVLITTLTKKMAEDLTTYLAEAGVRVEYLHSDIDTIERIEILRDLRLGRFDVLVGINLLREGLDLPEVSLVVILDADKEGFLRSRSALIQTMGRAARNAEGRVILYADSLTDSMKAAVGVTQQRRAAQEAYNEAHGIDPISVTKAVTDILGRLRPPSGQGTKRGTKARPVSATPSSAMSVAPDDVQALAAQLTRAMEDAAEELKFEEAALLRDELHALLASVSDPVEASLGAVGSPGPDR